MWKSLTGIPHNADIGGEKCGTPTVITEISATGDRRSQTQRGWHCVSDGDREPVLVGR